MSMVDYEKDGNKRRFRVNLGMRQKSNLRRRMALVATFPFMLAFNVVAALVFALVASAIGVVENNRELVRMTVVRWNKPKEG